MVAQFVMQWYPKNPVFKPCQSGHLVRTDRRAHNGQQIAMNSEHLAEKIVPKKATAITSLS
jgi:hypothetical protein